MEAKHQLLKELITFQGFYGGCNGQFPALMRVLAGVEYNATYSDQNPRTDAWAAVLKAVRRHTRHAHKHKKLTGKPTPLVPPTLESTTSEEDEDTPESVGDGDTPENPPDEDGDESDVEHAEDNDNGKASSTRIKCHSWSVYRQQICIPYKHIHRAGQKVAVASGTSDKIRHFPLILRAVKGQLHHSGPKFRLSASSDVLTMPQELMLCSSESNPSVHAI